MGRVINCHLESTRLSLTGKDYIAFLYSIAVSLSFVFFVVTPF